MNWLGNRNGEFIDNLIGRIMTPKTKLKVAKEFLARHNWPKSMAESILEGVEADKPVLESLCFDILARDLLVRIPTYSWINARANQSSVSPESEVIQRLLASGASARDLAIFARMMQEEYVSNLGCLLEGAGPFPRPKLPYEEFRVFTVDESEKPLAKVSVEYETFQFTDVKNEIRLSRMAAKFDKS